MRFTIHVYGSRGHALGFGGDGSNKRGSNDSSTRRVPLSDTGDVFSTPRSRFIDEVLSKIRARESKDSEIVLEKAA